MRFRLDNISLRQLCAIEEVALRSSFVEAASFLHITPSALSESVKSLEATLGLRLFDRTTRSVKLTAAGREFIEIVRAALGQLERAVQAAGELQNLERGLVRCIGATSAMACLVAPCLADMWVRAPQVRVEMRTGGASESLAALRSGDADFCVAALTAERSDDIEHLPLVHDCFGLVAHRDHSAVQATRVNLRKISDVPYVALTTLTTIDAMLAGQHDLATEFRQPSALVDGTGALAAVLQQGVAVGILPALAMYQIALDDLKFCPLTPALPDRTLVMSRLRDRSLTPAAQVLWDMVHKSSRSLENISGVRLA